MSLILATGSPYKRDVFDRLGLVYQSEPADIDESAIREASPGKTARVRARRKVEAVGRQSPDSWVVGSDQVVAIEGQILSKPETLDQVRAQLRRLEGRTHELIAAVAIRPPSAPILSDRVVHEMTMRSLSEKQIRDYVQTDQPVGCVGGYKIESAGIRLFRKCRGDDYTGIIGIPLTRVWSQLDEAGFFDDSNLPH